MRRARWAAAALCAGLACQVQAWSGHTLVTWEALSPIGELATRQVNAEPLEAFATKQASALEKLLQEHEAWARAKLGGYTPRPDELAFKAADTSPVVPRLLQALRLNSESRLKLFMQLRPGQTAGTRMPMPWVDITSLKSGSAARQNPYVLLEPGEQVSALDVLASASNEPDYGLDIGLYADNGTPQGQRYGFGKQPFGVGTVDYASQAPLHMAFWHEGGLIDAAAPFLRRVQPQARVALFSALARHAFESGHPYWGYRFTGWALHYVQDLTQPYHSRALPGVGQARMLAINALNMVGIKGPQRDAIYLVANRHIVVENYQYTRMSKALAAGERQDALLVALRDTSLDGSHRRLRVEDVREVVSAQAAASADALDEQLRRSFPAQYTDDPAKPLGNESDALDMFSIARGHSTAEHEALERRLVELMMRVGTFTRALVRSLTP